MTDDRAAGGDDVDLQGLDLDELDPEDLAELVRDLDDDTLEEAIHTLGTGAVLDRIFDGMVERFRPERAGGVDGVVAFGIDDRGDSHAYTLTIADGRCSTTDERTDDYRTLIKVRLIPFLHLITGQASGPALFMKRRLKLDGDMMFAARLMNFFEVPRA